jgi:hypothetical protein
VSVGKMYVNVLLLLRVLFIGAETWVGGERPLYEEEVVIITRLIWPKLLQQTHAKSCGVCGLQVTGGGGVVGSLVDSKNS